MSSSLVNAPTGISIENTHWSILAEYMMPEPSSLIGLLILPGKLDIKIRVKELVDSLAILKETGLHFGFNIDSIVAKYGNFRVIFSPDLGVTPLAPFNFKDFPDEEVCDFKAARLEITRQSDCTTEAELKEYHTKHEEWFGRINCVAPNEIPCDLVQGLLSIKSRLIAQLRLNQTETTASGRRRTVFAKCIKGQNPLAEIRPIVLSIDDISAKTKIGIADLAKVIRRIFKLINKVKEVNKLPDRAPASPEHKVVNQN